jgi:hypothetical protein
MFSRGEIARSLQGAWLLLCNRQEGLQWFDRSVEGFWRSFGVIFLLLPMSGLILLAEKKFLLEKADLLSGQIPDNAFWFAKLAAVGLDWIALPVVLAVLAGSIGIKGGYVSLIVARNWCSLLIALPQVAASVLYLLGIIPSGILVLFWMVLFLVAVWYWFNIVRFSLESPIFLTLGVVVLDFLLSYLIEDAMSRLWVV